MENGNAPKGKKGGGGGKKPANATKAKTSTIVRTKKEAQTKPLLTQKLISELLPLAINVADSPEKKVRKIRPSPFSKKSGSFLIKSGSTDSGSEDSASGATNEAQREDSVAIARPKRENRTRAVYVESGSEDENEDEDEVLSEYSNFEEEDDD